MNILVTNDDGIASEGIWQLAQALRDQGHTVTIVAPATDQSGTSMSLSQSETHVVHQIAQTVPERAGITAFAYEGTPVGCVQVALLGELCPTPDLVVSGINHGMNTGNNILLSGTVGAATVAAQWGFPALAISQMFIARHAAQFATAAHVACRLLPLASIARTRVGGAVVVNVNVPAVHALSELRGYRQTAISPFFFGNYLAADALTAEPNAATRSFRYRFLRERLPQFDAETDDGAVREGFVAITPIIPLADRPGPDLRDALAALVGAEQAQ